MTRAGGRSLGAIAAAMSFAMLGTGCYYGPTQGYEESSYASYRYPRYIPYTSLHFGIFSGRKHHYGHHNWQGAPNRHHGHGHTRGERHSRGGERGRNHDGHHGHNR